MLAKLAKFHFFRHFCRFEVGQLGQLHPFSLYLREDEVPPEPSSVFVGCGRVFEVPPTHRKKLAKLAKFRFYRPFCRFEVGQLGQLHLFSLHLREGEPKRVKSLEI